jgi:hypothetical protein
MRVRSLEQEIKLVEGILGVLYRCLTLYRELGDISQCKAIRNDIRLVEEELRILIAEKEAEIVATREP